MTSHPDCSWIVTNDISAWLSCDTVSFIHRFPFDDWPLSPSSPTSRDILVLKHLLILRQWLLFSLLLFFLLHLFVVITSVLVRCFRGALVLYPKKSFISVRVFLLLDQHSVLMLNLQQHLAPVKIRL